MFIESSNFALSKFLSQLIEEPAPDLQRVTDLTPAHSYLQLRSTLNKINSDNLGDYTTADRKILKRVVMKNQTNVR